MLAYLTPNQEKQDTNADRTDVAQSALPPQRPQLSIAVKQQVGCHGDAGSVDTV